MPQLSEHMVTRLRQHWGSCPCACTLSLTCSATNRWCACLQLMMPGGKSLAEDSIDDMAALATDSHWFSFRPKVIMPDNG